MTIETRGRKTRQTKPFSWIGKIILISTSLAAFPVTSYAQQFKQVQVSRINETVEVRIIGTNLRSPQSIVWEPKKCFRLEWRAKLSDKGGHIHFGDGPVASISYGVAANSSDTVRLDVLTNVSSKPFLEREGDCWKIEFKVFPTAQFSPLILKRQLESKVAPLFCTFSKVEKANFVRLYAEQPSPDQGWPRIKTSRPTELANPQADPKDFQIHSKGDMAAPPLVLNELNKPDKSENTNNSISPDVKGMSLSVRREQGSNIQIQDHSELSREDIQPKELQTAESETHSTNGTTALKSQQALAQHVSIPRASNDQESFKFSGKPNKPIKMATSKSLDSEITRRDTNYSESLTIDQAVLIAERKAFAVRIQQTTVERDRQAVALALASLGPSVGITTSLTQYGQQTTASLSPGTPPVVTSPFQGGTSIVSLTVPLDIAGNLNRLYTASRASFEAAKRTLEASFNDARLNARSAFLNVLRQRALVEVAKVTVRDAAERLHQAQLEFAQMQIARVDVDRLDAQVAQANSDLLNAQNNLHLANTAFNQALARPIETPVELVEVTNEPAPPTNVDQITKKAQETRPDAKALVDQIKALSYIRRAQEAGLNPNMTLGLNYERNLNPTFLSGNPNVVTGTLGLNIPIFDSGATRARVREARQDEAAAKIQLEQLQLSISQDIRNAITGMESAQSRMVNAQRQVTLAEEVYRIAKIRQDAGEGTYVEVVDAESSLEQARNGLVSAKYDYYLAYCQLQHAVGNDLMSDSTLSQTAYITGATN